NLRFARLRIAHEVDVVRKRGGPQSAALCPFPVQEGVAQGAEQVPEIVLVAKQAWPREYPYVCLLDEVFCVLPRPAQRPGSPIEPVEMVSQLGGIEPVLHRLLARFHAATRISPAQRRHITGDR